MDFESVTAAGVIDIFLLLLIGIGPKIVLVPFLQATAGLPAGTKRRVIRTMMTTAAIAAVVLLVLGGLLTRLLHFSPGSLGIAGGIILLIIAVSMILDRHDADEGSHPASRDPLQMAVYPLAVPYLLNPAGIIVLVTASAEAGSIGVFAVVAGALAVVLAIDVVLLSLASKLAKHLDENRMLVTEKVFAFLLAALAVQLTLNGLSDLGLIHLAHH